MGVNELEDKDYLETDQDKIAEDAYKALRPESPYKLGELVNKQKFKDKKYINSRRIEEKQLGGRCMFRSHAIKNPEELRQAILKGEVYISSPKKFLNKKDFANLKEDARLMHQYYSTSVNAPVELNKEFRLMKKDNVNLKKIKKSISTGFLGNQTKKDKLMVQMSNKIIDFCHGGLDMKKKSLKPSKRNRPSSFGKNTPDRSFHQNPSTKMMTHFKKGQRNRPKSGRVSSIHQRNKGLSRITTQGSYSSSKFGMKNSVNHTRESYIKYLAENKDNHITDIAAIV